MRSSEKLSIMNTYKRYLFCLFTSIYFGFLTLQSCASEISQKSNHTREVAFIFIPEKIELYSSGFIDSACLNCLPIFKSATEIDSFMKYSDVFLQITDKNVMNEIYQKLILSQAKISKRKFEIHTLAMQIFFKNGQVWKLSYSRFINESHGYWSLNQSILIENDDIIGILRDLHPSHDLTNYNSGIGKIYL